MTMTDPRYTILNADSLLALHDIADQTVDAVITDPPYSSGGQFRSDRTAAPISKYVTTGSSNETRLPDFDGDNRDQRGLLAWSSLWLAEAWRTTKPGGYIALFTDWRSLPTFSDALQAGGWVWRGVGVWVKPRARSRPTRGGLWRDTEFILWGSRGALDQTSEIYLPGTWTTPAPEPTTRRHLTEKPQPILTDLVTLAPPGGLVLDPFAGSGSTAVAALTQGRRALLIEQSADYTHIIRDRLNTITTTGADVAGLPTDNTLFTPTEGDTPE